MTSTARVLADSRDLPADPARGAVWSIGVHDRDLDSNLIRLPAHETIDAHTGGEVDVIIHVTSGSGVLVTDDEEQSLAPGTIAYLPRRSRRGFRAGQEGLEYLTVHRRKQALQIGSGPPSGAA